MNIVGKITRSLGFKAMLIVVLILVMLIPASLIRHLVDERSFRAEEVEDEIVESWGGELRIAGPLLRIPCRRLEEVTWRDERGKETKELRETAFDLWVSPKKAEMRIDLETTRKSRGIFSVPVFGGGVDMTGEFDASEAIASLKKTETAMTAEAEVVVAVDNQRGIRGIVGPKWGDTPLAFKPGDSGLGILWGGIHAAVDLSSVAAATFRMAMSVQGGSRVRAMPLGESVRVVMDADWPAPSFQGNHLPSAQHIDESGFEATWDISYLSRTMPLYWTVSQQAEKELKPDMKDGFFGVDLLEVLDHYALNERAVKYALLFIIVPFMTLFMLELFAKREIHPVQYLLAGIANMVFYLLLLSLSEHIRFGAAYFLSSTAVTVMVFLYSWSLFKSLARAWYMGPVMVLSYLYLYITLQSEDWALLIGSVGAFLIVGLVMYVTRNVDWYGRGRNRPAPIEEALE